MELPIDSDGPDLYRLVANGIAPCKLLSKLVPDSVPDGDLNFIVTDDDDRRENLELCLECAPAAGCDTSGVDIDDILAHKPVAVLALLWQLVRAPLLKEMAANSKALKTAGLKKLADPEAALLAFANALLKDTASNVAADWADGTRYAALLKAVAPQIAAKHKKALRDATGRSPAHLHHALMQAFAEASAAALTEPRKNGC